MSWKRKKKAYGANTYYSLVNKLRKDKKINNQFEVMFNSLSLEEVIGLKLELASKAAGRKLFGIPLWNSMQDIAKDAVLKYALSATRTKREAASFLGIDLQTFYKLQKKFNTEEYFKDFKLKQDL